MGQARAVELELMFQASNLSPFPGIWSFSGFPSKILFPGYVILDICRCCQKSFLGGGNSGEISFSQLVTKMKNFSTNFLNRKIPNSKPRGCQGPLFTPIPTPMKTRKFMYTHVKPRSSRNKLTRLPPNLMLCNRNPNVQIRLQRSNLPGNGIYTPGLKCANLVCVLSCVIVLLVADLPVSFTLAFLCSIIIQRCAVVFV